MSAYVFSRVWKIKVDSVEYVLYLQISKNYKKLMYKLR